MKKRDRRDVAVVRAGVLRGGAGRNLRDIDNVVGGRLYRYHSSLSLGWWASLGSQGLLSAESVSVVCTLLRTSLETQGKPSSSNQTDDYSIEALRRDHFLAHGADLCSMTNDGWNGIGREPCVIFVEMGHVLSLQFFEGSETF